MKNYNIYLISILVGAFAGIICIGFRYIVSYISSIRPHIFTEAAIFLGVRNPILIHIMVFLFVFAILLFVGLLVKWFPRIEGSGLPQTQALLYGRTNYVKPYSSLLVKFIGGVMSLGTGLSLGREGSSIQMGSLTGYIAGNIFNVRRGRRRHLIAAGAGAGVSAAFTAPLSSSILIIESLQKFNMPQMTICTLLAGAVSGIMAKLLIPYNIYDNINVYVPNIKEWILIIICIIMAIYFSLLGKIFSIALIQGKKTYQKLDTWKYSKYTKGIVPKAALLSVITFTLGIFFPTMMGGDQTFLIQHSGNEYINTILLITLITIISLFTILSNSTGYPGGIFLPMMTIGGLSGKLFYEFLYFASKYFHNIPDLQTFANSSFDFSGYFILIGMSAFFISVVRTPLTGFILIIEMTGHFEVLFPTIIVGILVYYFTELLKITPMNQVLYYFMIKKEKDIPLKTTIYIEVGTFSYFVGKTPSKITLPQGCQITNVYRDNKPILFNDNNPLEPDDQIGIEVNSYEIEQVYQSLVSMSY